MGARVVGRKAMAVGRRQTAFVEKPLVGRRCAAGATDLPMERRLAIPTRFGYGMVACAVEGAAMLIVQIAFLSAALAAAPAPTASDAARQAEANAAFNLYPKESMAHGEQGTVSYHVKID